MTLTAANDTFLLLCTDFIDEYEIGGGTTGFTDVETETQQELKLAIKAIQRADLRIQQEQLNWRFMWTEYSETLAIDTDVSLAHSGTELIKHWKLKSGSVWLDRSLNTAVDLEYIIWDRWYENIDHGIKSTSTPGLFTVKPDNGLIFDVKAKQAYTLTGQFFRRPMRMIANADLTPIPGEFRDLLLMRSAIEYAKLEDAPEIGAVDAAEYASLMEDMMFSEMEGYRENAESDPNLVVEVA